jgi:hypothetical protein
LKFESSARIAGYDGSFVLPAGHAVFIQLRRQVLGQGDLKELSLVDLVNNRALGIAD